MSERILFDLAPGWRLNSDHLQWIVEKWRPPKWRAVAFVATEKAVLERILRDQGISFTSGARRALDHLPPHFCDLQKKSPRAAATASRAKSHPDVCKRKEQAA